MSTSLVAQEQSLLQLSDFVNRHGASENRELSSMEDGGLQDDLDEMSNDEILEFSNSLPGVKEKK